MGEGLCEEAYGRGPMGEGLCEEAYGRELCTAHGSVMRGEVSFPCALTLRLCGGSLGRVVWTTCGSLRVWRCWLRGGRHRSAQQHRMQLCSSVWHRTLLSRCWVQWQQRGSASQAMSAMMCAGVKVRADPAWCSY